MMFYSLPYFLGQSGDREYVLYIQWWL